MAYQVQQLHRNRHILTVKESVELLLISDVHFDSVKCDRQLLHKHLKKAEQQGAFVFINGDWFDLMQGRYDPRGSKDAIRPEYKRSQYLDCVIQDSTDYLSSFQLQYFIAQGNHETNVLKRQETNVTERLVERLNMKSPNTAWLGGYSGWFKVRLRHGEKSGAAYNIHYHHGYGGHAPRSKGMLKADINQMQYPDANMILRGHDHNKWHLPMSVQRLTTNFEERPDIIDHIQLGSYKSSGDRYSGWEVEKGFNQPTLGGYWATLTQTRQYVDGVRHRMVDVEITPAR